MATSSSTSLKIDIEVIRDVIDGIYAAWAAGDAEQFVVHYAEDATATLPGAYLNSKQAVKQAMAELFAGPLRGSRAQYEIDQIRFVGEETAVVNSRSVARYAGQDAPDDADWNRDTWVLHAVSEWWLVDAYHSCPISAGAR
ncbi:SgcJ/EcaC family oxidoreductase [Nocardia araoensis]|uniref:SgcJ/EcaC family oxidoreductase n=1 Tax=Nocardia araoensis TaxID=228600 RepID=UPI00031E837D|nr:SgcJ/EcaC family oxidoreductase [Nocardia araoensis]